MSLLIEDCVVIPDPLGDKIRHASVAVQEGRIVGLGSRQDLQQQYPGSDRLDGDGMWLLPGLIDAHTHLYAALTLGMPSLAPPPRDFPQVLDRIWWRWDKALKAEDFRYCALVGAFASMRSGITTLIDHHASPRAVPDSLSVLASALEEIGLRACLAYEVSDRDGEESREQGIAENKRFIKEVQKKTDNTIRAMFGLHAVFSLSDETLRRCANEAHELGVGCHLHVAEHQPEVEKFAETHKEGIVEFLSNIGILGPKSIAAHTVQFGIPEIREMKKTGTFNVHNPKSNMGNGVGIAAVTDMLEEGQLVCLGSDGYYDIPQEMQITGLLQNLRKGDPSAFSDSLALRMVYGNGAILAEKLFGVGFGKIEVGYAADMILTPYRPATPVTTNNLSSHVLMALNGGVDTLLVDGRILMKGGEIPHLDEGEVLAEAAEHAQGIWERL
jgi:putative selenium metabolism protein SsnA